MKQVALWLGSIVAAAVLLGLVVRFGSIELWPDPLILPAPWLLAAACLVQIPYTCARAMRLRFVLDPLVRGTSERAGGTQTRFDWRVLQGSGMVSYPIVIMLPFRLGELSRPLLLTRAEQPGVGFAESVSAIAVERVVDGLLVVGMLFFGLAFASLDAGTGPAAETMAYIHGFGRLMALTFVLGLVVLLAAAARPELLERIVRRTVPGRFGERAARAAGRVAATIAVLLDWRRGLPFMAWSLVYWTLTICQLWLVLLACGLALGFADAAAVVAIVGLAIQLPGGPAQAGSFQVGMAAALALLTGADQLQAASSFAALMYLLQLGGAALLALPGLWLLARARRDLSTHAQAPAPGAARADAAGGRAGEADQRCVSE